MCKEPDRLAERLESLRVMFDNLLWIYYANEDIRLIKLPGHRAIDNVAPTLLLEPQSVYYFGNATWASELKKFFQGHGNNTKEMIY